MSEPEPTKPAEAVDPQFEGCSLVTYYLTTPQDLAINSLVRGSVGSWWAALLAGFQGAVLIGAMEVNPAAAKRLFAEGLGLLWSTTEPVPSEGGAK